MPARFLRIGLTGGLACGKSTVVAVFADAGVATIDADQLARDALAPGSSLIPQVVALLGDAIVRADGTLDRRRIAELVFDDDDRRRALEALIHPSVLAAEEDSIAELRASGAAMVVVDMPLLLEVGRRSAYDYLIVVACDERTQIERAVARGMSAADARARIAAQMPIADKRAQADFVIDTTGIRVEETQDAAREILTRLSESVDGNDASAGRDR